MPEVASRRSAAAAQECVNRCFVCGKAASFVLIAQPILFFETAVAQAMPSNHWNASISS